MTSLLRLTILFRNLALTSAAVAAASGCSDPSVDRSIFDADACKDGYLDRVAGVTPAAPVDYLELRGVSPYESTGQFTTMAKAGTACANASDAAACEASLTELRPDLGWTIDAVDHQNKNYLIYTRGDEVGTVGSLTELAAFVAPVDTSGDAALIATAHGYMVLCDGNNAHVADDGVHLLTQTGFACGEGSHEDQQHLKVSRDGTISVVEEVRLREGDAGCAVGRWTGGLEFESPIEGSAGAMGDYLAGAAELEAAAVHAFDRLARELRAHGAPEALVREAERARADEVRHARTMTSLAKAYGATPRAIAEADLPVRSLLEVALENAAEGCVRETFGALTGTIQADRATDPRIRRAMQVIAIDETRHAALAWDVAAWAEERLGEAEVAEVRAARGEAVRRLAEELGAAPAPVLVREAGMVGAAEATSLVTALSTELWAA